MRDKSLAIEIYSAFQMDRIEFARKQHKIFLLSICFRSPVLDCTTNRPNPPLKNKPLT